MLRSKRYQLLLTVCSASCTTGDDRTRRTAWSAHRPTGAVWRPLTGQDPVGAWSLALDDRPTVRSSLSDGSIQDIVLVMTVAASSPLWP